ncbi:MAG: NUDIX domain-containing protein [Oculatellaceae cyanobacterium bins.114]|nr:NUDIX domain-containing protein [Oculatellaceae cyanobacterium bins.114]
MQIHYLSKVLTQHPNFSPGWHPQGIDCPLTGEKFGTILHIVVCNDAGYPLYDQPVWAEPVGAIIVPVDETGRIGFIETFRVAPPAKGNRSIYPPTELNQHGLLSLELPRGFPEQGEAPEETARRETEEEMGIVVRDVVLLGENNTNTTFFLNNIPVWLAHVDKEATTLQSPDPIELIRKTKFFLVSEVMDLITSGRIVCGITKAGLLHYLAWLQQGS